MTLRCAVYAVPGIMLGDGPDSAAVRALAQQWIARTVTARRYGYHATLKAPFRLRDGLTVDTDVVPAVAEFAQSHGPVAVPAIDLRRISGFWALTPGAPAAELTELAAAVVRAFDSLRAAPTEAEVARRRPERLSQRQRELLRIWGYPYVLDEFRFHITLTDELPGPEQTTRGDALRAEFAAHLGVDLPVSALVLFVEPQPGADFILRSVHPLTAAQEAQ